MAPLVHQRWEDVAFVHHAYPPEAVAALLPEGLVPDTFGGSAWVGITPFRMRSGVAPFLSAPRITVGEVNVRTYVRDAAGSDAIWFLTLELDHLVAATALRAALGVPYRWASVEVAREGDEVRYRSRRRAPHAPARLDLRICVGDPLGDPEPPPLETFLSSRWRAYTRTLGVPVAVPVEHEPWPLRGAELLAVDTDLLTDLGLPPPAGEPHVMFSPGVEVRIGFPRPLR
ncbi:MAG: DUF2071 domain-containing protein [Actinobacteria bacterium]|nr:DUF2071 domain-containing protein [Actinomycetota bacterium]